MNREERRAQLRRRLKAFGFRVEKVCTELGLATLAQVHYQPNDTHHCCGRYIRSSVDRAQHNAIFHKVAVFLVALAFAASTALAGGKIVAKSADICVTYFANDLIYASGERPDPRVLYRIDGMNTFQKVPGGYILMETSFAGDILLSSPIFLRTDAKLGRNVPVTGWVKFIGYHRAVSIDGFGVERMAFAPYDIDVPEVYQIQHNQVSVDTVGQTNVDVDGEIGYGQRPGAR